MACPLHHPLRGGSPSAPCQLASAVLPSCHRLLCRALRVAPTCARSCGRCQPTRASIPLPRSTPARPTTSASDRTSYFSDQRTAASRLPTLRRSRVPSARRRRVRRQCLRRWRPAAMRPAPHRLRPPPSHLTRLQTRCPALARSAAATAQPAAARAAAAARARLTARAWPRQAPSTPSTPSQPSSTPPCRRRHLCTRTRRPQRVRSRTPQRLSVRPRSTRQLAGRVR